MAGALVVFSEEAENYLIDKGVALSKRQRQVIADLVEQLSADPLLGDPPPFPEWTPCDYWVERHLGGRIHAAFYYDVERSPGRTTVRIRAIRIGMKM